MLKVINDDNVVSSKYLFYHRITREPIKVTSAEFDDSGSITKVTGTSNGITAIYDSSQFVYTNLILEVPGLGTAVCGDKLLLKPPRKKLDEYTLEFGWHTNYSNQQIYSWYLIPVITDLDKHELPKAKTLYYDDLCNVVGISNQLSICLPTDIEQKLSGTVVDF
jgi:hypothetical protein